MDGTARAMTATMTNCGIGANRAASQFAPFRLLASAMSSPIRESILPPPKCMV
jgi:hypothetical protein